MVEDNNAINHKQKSVKKTELKYNKEKHDITEESPELFRRHCRNNGEGLEESGTGNIRIPDSLW
jgi:hypothetical protein